MAKEDTIFSRSKLRYNGSFDLTDIYKKLRVWIMQGGYSDPEEEKYVEKVKPEGKTIEFVWKTTKNKEGGYFRFTIKIEFFYKFIKEKEETYKGRKIKLDNGEAEIFISSSLIRNANGKWNEHGLMFKIYEKYVIPDKIEDYKIEVYKDTNLLMEEIKNYISLYKFG